MTSCPSTAAPILAVLAIVLGLGNMGCNRNSTAGAKRIGLGVKISGPAQLTVGEEQLYEIEVRNQSLRPLSDVRVNFSYSPSVRPTAMTDGGEFARSSVQWTHPDLAVGQTISFEFKAQAVKANAQARHVASVSASEGFSQSSEVTTAIIGSP
jgi:hypothetical protein